MFVCFVQTQSKQTQKKTTKKQFILKAVKVFEKKGDIYVKFNNGGLKRLTFDGSNTEPALSPSKTQVVFIKNQNEAVCDYLGCFDGVSDRIFANQIWVSDVYGKNQQLVLDGETYVSLKDYCLCHSMNPHFSLSEKEIYFQTPAGTVVDYLNRINVDGTEAELLTYGSLIEVIDKGKYQGYLKIWKLAWGPGGRGGEGRNYCQWIFDPKTKQLIKKLSCEW
jgi:hypothetical protein